MAKVACQVGVVGSILASAPSAGDATPVDAPNPPARAREDSTALVIAFVRDRIARGGARPGDRLPPERELAAQLGVSRPTLYDLMRRLGIK